MDNNIIDYIWHKTSYECKLLESFVITQKVQYMFGELQKYENKLHNYFLLLKGSEKNFCIDISGRDFDLIYFLDNLNFFCSDRDIAENKTKSYNQVFYTKTMDTGAN